MGFSATLVQALEDTLPSRITSEIHSVLSHTFELTLYFTIHLFMVLTFDKLVSFFSYIIGITRPACVSDFLLWCLELPISAELQQRMQEVLHPWRETDIDEALEVMGPEEALEVMRARLATGTPSYPILLPYISICLELGFASSTSAYNTSGFSLLSLWQLYRLAVVAMPRGVIVGMATWSILREGLWYFRTRFGSNKIAEQEVESSKRKAYHGIPESQMSQEEV